MKGLLLLIVIFLSACQSVVDNSKKLSTFKSKSNSPYQVIDESNLWTLIANNQQINSEINPRIQSQINRIKNKIIRHTRIVIFFSKVTNLYSLKQYLCKL